MKIRKLLCTVLALCLLLVLPLGASAAEVASGTCGENVTWTLTDDGMLTISGEGEMKDYSMPTKYSYAPWYPNADQITGITVGEGVTYIGAYSFFDLEEVTEVNLPEGLLEIGTYAFSGCENVTAVTLPTTLTEIGDVAFSNTALTKITIPAGTTVVGGDAFAVCSDLEAISVESGNTKYSSDAQGILYNKEMTVLLDCPDAFEGKCVVPSGVAEISDRAFSQCDALTAVHIPASVTYIGQYAFFYLDDVKDVYFLGDVPEIQDWSFEGTTATVYYPDDNATWTDDVMQNYGGELTWVSMGESAAPAAPVVKGSNLASTGKIKLSWAKVEGAAKYQVYRSTSKSEGYKLLKTVTGTTFTNTSAVAGTTYYYYVVAVAEDGTVSENSAIVTRTCDYARPVVKATNAPASGIVKLTWEEVEGATEYQVYRSTKKSSGYTLVKTTSYNYYNEMNEAPGATYYYKVKAAGSKSAALSAYSVAVLRTVDCAQPLLEATTVASTGKVKLTWNKVNGAVGYEVYRSTSRYGTYTLLKTVKGTSFTNSSAKAGVEYYYKIKAVGPKTAANSVYSESRVKTCDLAQPVVSITLTSSGNPKLTWNAVSGAVKYRVYRATSENGSYKLMKTTTGTSYTNTSAVDYETYYYKVRAIHTESAANSAYSAVKFISATSVNAWASDLEKEALDLINDYRDSKGLPELSWYKPGEIAARTRAAEVAVHPYYERPDGTALDDMLVPYGIGMELSYTGCTTASEAVEFMMSLEDAEYVMLDIWESVVVASNGDSWTFLFVVAEE